MRHVLIVLIFLGGPLVCFADPVPPSWEENRLSGFREHVRDQKIYDREREKGEKAFIEEQEQWERDRQAAIADHKKRAKTLSPAEGGPEHQAHLQSVKKQELEYLETEREYSRLKSAMARQKRRSVDVTEAEELGLDENRPRYDVSKRVLYGAPAKFQTGRISSGGAPSGGRGGGRFQVPTGPGGNFGEGGDEMPPTLQDGEILPPPTFEDSMSDLPPPPPPIEYDDLPPPPPPEAFDPEDFPPPPDFGDFPPPPPPPPMDF